MSDPTPRLMKLGEVMHRTGLSKPTIYNYIRKGQFPKPVKLGPRGIGFIESEVVDWITDRITLRNHKEALTP